MSVKRIIPTNHEESLFPPMIGTAAKRSKEMPFLPPPLARGK